MVSVNQKSGNEGVAAIPRGRPPKNFRSLPAAKYHEIRAKNPNLSKKQAAILAGYSPKSNNIVAEKTDLTLLESIERQRDIAVKSTGYTIKKALEILVADIADNKQSHDSDRIRAIHEANSMLPGYHAPKDVQVNTKSLFVEFSGLGSSDLAAMVQAMQGDNG